MGVCLYEKFEFLIAFKWNMPCESKLFSSHFFLSTYIYYFSNAIQRNWIHGKPRTHNVFVFLLLLFFSMHFFENFPEGISYTKALGVMPLEQVSVGWHTEVVFAGVARRRCWIFMRFQLHSHVSHFDVVLLFVFGLLLCLQTFVV